MSAAAIQLLDHLRENGVEDQRAVKIAEAFDKRVEDAMREAKAHADKGRAESEAQAERIRAEAEKKAKAQFVTVDEYHKRDRDLATREDLNAAVAALRADHRADNAALRAEVHADNAALRAEVAEVRAEVRATNRLLIGGFITVVTGIVALVAKAFIGI